MVIARPGYRVVGGHVDAGVVDLVMNVAQVVVVRNVECGRALAARPEPAAVKGDGLIFQIVAPLGHH